MANKRVELVSFDYDEDGSLSIVFSPEIFPIVRQAIEQEAVAERADGAIAVNIGALGFKIKYLAIHSDQPPCEWQ